MEKKNLFIFIAIILLATCFIMVSATIKSADLRDYALAACLTKQTDSAELQSEGYHLASIVIQRTNTSPLTWLPLGEPVKAELSDRPMMTVHVDAPVDQSSKAAPLAHCLSIIDSSSVKKAMLMIRLPLFAESVKYRNDGF